MMERLCRVRMSVAAFPFNESAASTFSDKGVFGVFARNFSNSSILPARCAALIAGPNSLLVHRPTTCYNTRRTLFTKQSLGLDKYEVQRERTAQTLGNMLGKFSERMKTYLAANEHAPVFTEDLKNMSYIAQEDSDIELLQQMLERYHTQSAQMRFSSFTFGPIIMRLYYTLGKPDLALKAIFNPKLEGFFDQLSSYQVAMDLLYENKRYDDVLRVYDQLVSRNFYVNRFPQESAMIAAAACYCLNTPESLVKMKEIISKCNDSGGMTLRRAVTMASHLALKQNDPSYALEVLNLSATKFYVSVVNLRCLAMARLGRVDDCLMQMRQVAERELSPERKRGFFSPEVIQEIKTYVENTKDEELMRSFEKLYKNLQDMNEIGDMTLEEALLQPIDKRPRPPQMAVERGMQAYNARVPYGQRTTVMPRNDSPYYQSNAPNRGPPREQQTGGYRGGGGYGGGSVGRGYQPRNNRGRFNNLDDEDDMPLGDEVSAGGGQQRNRFGSSGGRGGGYYQQRQGGAFGRGGGGGGEDEAAEMRGFGGGGGGRRSFSGGRGSFGRSADGGDSAEENRQEFRARPARAGLFDGSSSGGGGSSGAF